MTEKQSQTATINSGTTQDSADTPTYFPVSLLKLMVMSTCTLGIYELYWYYKNWSLIKEREKLDIMPFWRAVFAYFFCYSLFKKIQATAESQGIRKSIAPGFLAAGWIVITLLWKLPDPYWLLAYFAVLTLLPVQSVVNEINQITNPKNDPNKKFTRWNIAGIVIGGLLFVLALIGTFLPET